jgi:hypothetical protein
MNLSQVGDSLIVGTSFLSWHGRPELLPPNLTILGVIPI